MENLATYVTDHLKVVGLFFACLAGIAGYNCFRAGLAVAMIRGDIARTASEALGG